MSVFTKVPIANPKKSVFNNSYDKMMSMRIGKLYIGGIDELVPGDIMKIRHTAVYRVNPLNAPFFGTMKAYSYSFFCPTRILDENFPKFLTQAMTGEDAVSLPRWEPDEKDLTKNSLWDNMGYPLVAVTGDSAPLSYGKRAYNLIFNEFFRDEKLQEEVDLDNNDLLDVNYTKDYFTSASEAPQVGTEVTLPLGSSAPVVNAITNQPDGFVRFYDSSNNLVDEVPYVDFLSASNKTTYKCGDTSTGVVRALNALPKILQDYATSVGASNYRYEHDTSTGSYTDYMGIKGDVGSLALKSANGLNPVTPTTSDVLFNMYPTPLEVDLTNATASTISDLRLAVQIQKLKERGEICGYNRYADFLKSNYGTAPRDETLQRPVFIGGTNADIIVNEVEQTSRDTSENPRPTGYLTGKGLGVDSNYVGTYRVKEFGYLVTLVCIRPKICYTQGIQKQWLRSTPYDFFNPLFIGLSQNAIFNEEIFAQVGDGIGKNDNRGVFGYQGMYDELRTKMSYSVGELRDTFSYWTLNREFASLPNLNGEFLKVRQSDVQNILAVPNEFFAICCWHNDIKAIRPIPKIHVAGIRGI